MSERIDKQTNDMKLEEELFEKQKRGKGLVGMQEEKREGKRG